MRVPLTPPPGLVAIRSGLDIDFTWTDAGTTDYDLWYVLEKRIVDRARIGDPLAMGVLDCSPPMPATSPACRDRGAITRDTTMPFYYQARAVCGSSEGP